MPKFVRLTEVLKICSLCIFVVPFFHPWFHPDTFWSFWFFLFGFYFMSKKYYLSKLMLLIFHCQKIYSLCKHDFFNEEHTQWDLDTKVKVFHKSISCFMKCPWNFISWNALKEQFHSVFLPLMNNMYSQQCLNE